ncbi:MULTISPECIES: hypothetical protein [Flavobacterium]|uniref:DUF4199 domain-containing protein n=1 Tax=Flavobacterium gawalongense TaxID=2594432 RepID=A0A553BDR7_9FLAO|nr:hypothetical protein [Flavobacterium gawalongense]TRX01884.1 hypothetical protein FNW33_08295 [Flavobacterium gawalongense]TRX06338.1 hypothetical protein FNW12_08830 [Flavobacterium gawalongense]TRX06388.1 hypothetical protein FNW11_14560 [Flavobacterium gawalongense]TRX12743.1 hypothetical protein FNW10_04120 [Flavobacterium gawalongense]TRX30468.1 hypothetical protein FNW38_03625 [Flavobacterium gawalongense]
MKLPKELLNGCIIFIGIGVYFLLMNALGFADVFYLRLINVFFVFYGVNRTIEMNLAEGKKNFVANAISAMITSLIGVFLSIIGLVIYSSMNGGSYVKSLPKTFLFGGNPSVNTYSICLLFEGIASSVIVTMLLMLYWNNRHATD